MTDQHPGDQQDAHNEEGAASTGRAATIVLSRDIRVETDEYGELRLQRIVLGNLSELVDLLKQELPMRAFIGRFIGEVLISPELDEDVLASWSDELLARVAIEWLREVAPESASPFDEAQTLEDVEAALRTQIAGQQAILDHAMVRMFDPGISAVESIQKRLVTLNDLAQTINATRFQFATPRFELPMVSVTSAFDSLSKAYDLSRMGVFLEAHRSALEATARLQTPILSNLGVFQGTANQESALSSMIAQLSSASVGVGSVASFTSAIGGLQSSISQIAASARSIGSAIQTAFATAIPRFPVGTILPNLPDLTTLAPGLDRARRAYTALDEGGFSFTGHLWNWSFFLSFANAGTKVTGAAVTTRMLRYTQGTAFKQGLQDTIEGSTVLRRRWGIIGPALAAHARREYHLAIPTLLAQLEGVIGDALILKGSVRIKGHKLIERLPNGRDKLDRNGDLVVIRGLDRLVRISPFLQHDALDLAADLILNSIAKDRNAILHGRSTNYGKAKFSTQLVLMIYAFAAEIAAFEAGQVTW